MEAAEGNTVAKFFENDGNFAFLNDGANFLFRNNCNVFGSDLTILWRNANIKLSK